MITGADLWPVAKRANGDDEDETDVQLQEDFEDIFSCTVTQEVEGIGFRICGCRGYQLQEP